MDYKRMFDCVDRGTLWAVLAAYGVPAKLVLRSLYVDTNIRVRVDGSLSRPVGAYGHAPSALAAVRGRPGAPAWRLDCTTTGCWRPGRRGNGVWPDGELRQDQRRALPAPHLAAHCPGAVLGHAGQTARGGLAAVQVRRLRSATRLLFGACHQPPPLSGGGQLPAASATAAQDRGGRPNPTIALQHVCVCCPL
eukprot:327787-Chlamydomonas_euryale.AAC.1